VDDQVQDVITICNREKELVYLPQIQPTNETTAQSRQKLKPTCDLFLKDRGGDWREGGGGERESKKIPSQEPDLCPMFEPLSKNP
jgi:hypothetical protein